MIEAVGHVHLSEEAVLLRSLFARLAEPNVRFFLARLATLEQHHAINVGSLVGLVCFAPWICFVLFSSALVLSGRVELLGAVLCDDLVPLDLPDLLLHLVMDRELRRHPIQRMHLLVLRQARL